MSHMNTVIHTQSHRDDQVDTRDGVNCQTPKMHHTSDIYNWQNDHQQNKNGVKETSKEQKSDNEYAQDCQSNVSIEFLCDDLIRLPYGVPLRKWEDFSCQIWFWNDFLDPVHCWDVLLGSIKYLVSEGYFCKENKNKWTKKMELE